MLRSSLQSEFFLLVCGSEAFGVNMRCDRHGGENLHQTSAKHLNFLCKNSLNFELVTFVSISSVGLISVLEVALFSHVPLSLTYAGRCCASRTLSLTATLSVMPDCSQV